ncbi:unnamed protein product [Amoebophrya sp. A25]|nr:unnamed protein product [Amoebophrya sp. A25]|eukprot:GSA25T00007880001.1
MFSSSTPPKMDNLDDADQKPKKALVSATHFWAEFWGTYLVVLTIGCNVLGGSGDWAVLSIGFALILATYVFGPISGGHFNPCVSVAVFLAGKFDGEPIHLLYYVGAQFLGGFTGAITYYGMYGQTFELGAGSGYTLWNAGSVEFLFTCLLCLVHLNVCYAKMTLEKDNQYFGMALGFVLIAGAYAVGAISGGCFNPAVSLARYRHRCRLVWFQFRRDELFRIPWLPSLWRTASCLPLHMPQGSGRLSQVRGR